MPTLRQQIRDFYDAHRLSDAKLEVILSVTQAVPEAAKVVEFPRTQIVRRMALAAVLLLCAALAFQFGVRRPKEIVYSSLTTIKK